MSASTVLSVIAPVVGAAPSPSATADETASADFTAMVMGAGDAAEAEVAPVPAVAPAQPRAAPAKTSHIPLIAEVVETPVDAADLAPTPAPAVETQPAPPAPAPAPVEAEASDDSAEPEVSPAAVEEPALPVAAAPLKTQPTLISTGAPAPAAVATPGPSGDVAAAPSAPSADAPAPVEEATQAEAKAGPATDTADLPPQTAPQPTAPPLKGEPVRMASATRETKEPRTSAETASITTHDAAKASPSAGSTTPPAAPVQTAASAVTAPRVDAAPLKPLEAVAPTIPAESPAAATATQDAPAAPAEVVTSTLSRATVETTVQIAAQIARRLEGKQTRFDMILTPEDLGRVEVSLDIDPDGRLAARLAFDNPAAAADLRGRADELRRQLTDAGFHLAGDSLEFSERDPNAFSGGAFERGQNRAFSFAGGKRLGDQADLAVAGPPAWINLSLTPDRVDMRV